MKTPRVLGALVAASLIGTACTGGSSQRTVRSPTPTAVSPSPRLSPTPNAEDQRPPCRRPKNKETKAKPARKRQLPAALEKVAKQVEDVRGLMFRRPVNPRAVTREEINKQLGAGIEEGFPRGVARRQQRAWATIGAVPPGTDLREAFKEFSGSAIVGFYDTDDKRLVYIGTESPSPLQRKVLAHELTHALDDQHFKIDRLDDLDSACRDEEGLAYLSLVEGSAESTSQRWASENLTPSEIAQMQVEESSQGGGVPSSVPPFFLQLIIFPYPNGTAFVSELLARGGTKALDEAFRDPPVSTEQILHPEKYPDDAPQDVSVPDLKLKLGPKWKDLEFEDVGEGWLHILLDLRVGPEQSDQAAEGWDGGQYRAWSDGKDTAVVMDTVWDSEKDAEEFAEAMKQWLASRVGDVLTVRKTRVRMVFASDRETLADLRKAAQSSPLH